MGKIDERFKAKQRKVLFNSEGLTLAEALRMNKGVVLQPQEKPKYKGHYDGYCNRSACLSPDNVHYYNIGSYAFYCPDCAHELNACNARFKDVNNGEPYVTFKTPEEAAECHVIAKALVPDLTQRSLKVF